MPKHGTYLYKRKDSENWWAEFQYPVWARTHTGRRKRQIPLGTPDRKLAEILVLSHAREFKIQMLVLRANRDGRVVQTTSCRYPEGHSGPGPNGVGHFFVSKGLVHHYGADGALIRSEPNQDERYEILTEPSEAEDIERLFYQDTRNASFSDGVDFDKPDASGFFGMIERVGEAPATRRKVIRSQAPAEDELGMHVERWLTDTHKTKDIRNEVMGVLAIWRDITAGKPLKDCGRADGVKLRDHLFKENASQTVQKKVGLLAASLNYSALEYDYAGPNPFRGLVTKEIKRRRRDSVAGRAFSEDDMAKVRAALPTWNDPDCVRLWVLCATTGMRRGEAFLIESEDRPVGTLRCITIIPTNEDDSIKNEDSQRMIPIPADAIPYLPEKITGRLFQGTPKNVGKRLMTKLHALGVTGRGKTLKSTRHRAAQRLQNLRVDGHYCPEKLRYQILGHEFDTVADKVYAKGLPQDMLKPWIDVIGLGPADRSA